MKIAITSIYSNLQYAPKNPRGLECMYMHKIFSKKGDVELVGKKNRNNKDVDFFIDVSEADWSSYDLVLVQLTPANFFGGQYSQESVAIAEGISTVPAEKVAFVVVDPNIDAVNPCEAFARFDELQDPAIKERWANLVENGIYMFPGKDIKKFLGHDVKNVKFWPMFLGLFKDRLSIDFSPSTIEKEYDVVYYGDRRGGFREKQIRKYFPTDTNNLLIGYKTDKVKAEFKKKLPHADLMVELDKVKVSLVLGDEGHLDNVVTFRLYETLASNCLAAIQIEYDPNKELIQDPVLRDLLYVSSAADVKKLAEAYSPELIERQKKELQRMFDSI